ncbi:MAG TPA: LysR family transcriptional regulator, partial [Spongiibacteraceae bacterium]
MDTQLLQAFAAVAENSSFSVAAEQLHLTQPAVSKRIALLEGQLDCSLFDRIGRQITLTEAGRALLPRAQSVLQEIRDAKRHIQDLRGGVTGLLTMGISHHMGLHRLPAVLQQFTQQYPDVRLDIDFLDSEEAYERVLLGEVELGVITLAPEEKPSLQQIAIWKDELVVTVARNHPLAKQTRVNAKALSNYRAILPGLNTYTGRIIKTLFEEQKLPLDVSMSTNYLETIKVMVSIGLGWSVLPKTLVDKNLRGLLLSGQKLNRNLGVVMHRERSLSNAANAFLQLLLAA